LTGGDEGAGELPPEQAQSAAALIIKNGSRIGWRDMQRGPLGSNRNDSRFYVRHLHGSCPRLCSYVETCSSNS